MADKQKPAAREAAAKGGEEPPKMTVAEVLQRADIALDDYDDIFSDFDISPFSKRLLSEDFLYELRRRYPAGGKGGFAVNFTLPQGKRSEKTESLIKKRLKDHFRSRLKVIDGKRRDKLHNGAIRVSIGILLSSILFVVPELTDIPALTIFYVLIWYSTWSGLENILQASTSFQKKSVLAEKLMKAEYRFTSEEDVVRSLEEAQAAQSQKPAPGSPKSS